MNYLYKIYRFIGTERPVLTLSSNEIENESPYFETAHDAREKGQETVWTIKSKFPKDTVFMVVPIPEEPPKVGKYN